MTTRSTLATCPPVWATRRRPERATWGPKVGQIAARLGRPFMPWQQYVLDVALEINPDTGELAYREVIVTVPRQSGKTSLVLPRMVWRAEAAHLLGGRQTMLYAAQNGKDAKKKWRREFLEDLKGARVMRGRFTQHLQPNNEHVRFLSGSTFGPIARTPTSGHGDTLDDGNADEIFAHATGLIEDAWRPAMITRKQAQFWGMSTAGTRSSLYLRNKVERGRAIVEAGRVSRSAYFEWSADKDLDPEDPATWRGCMPALGHTIREEDIRHEFESIEGGLPAFRRAYLNQWSDEFDDEEWIIPKASWFMCQDESSTRVGALALAMDMSPTRTSGSIGFSALQAEGLPMAQIVRHGDGTEWLVPETAKLARENGATCVVIDGAGPAANKRDELQKLLGDLCPVVALDGPEMANAAGTLSDGVVTGQFRHTGQKALDDALGAAVKIMQGDRWKFGRVASGRKSGTDISPIVCASMAGRGRELHPGKGSILW